MKFSKLVGSSGQKLFDSLALLYRRDMFGVELTPEEDAIASECRQLLPYIEIDRTYEYGDEETAFYTDGDVVVVDLGDRALGQKRKETHELCGVISKDGWVIPPMYDYLSNFGEDLFIVMDNHKCGLINKKNEVVLPSEYDWIFSLQSNGHAMITKHSGEKTILRLGKYVNIMRQKNYGFVNKNGKIVIPLEYDSAREFDDGYAEVRKDGKRGWIDTEGTWYDIHPEGKDFAVTAQDIYDKVRKEKHGE